MTWNAVPYISALVAGVALLATRLLWRRARRVAGARLWARRTASGFAAVPAVLSLAAGGWSFWYTHRPQPAPGSLELFRGVSYVRDVRQRPRPLVIHVVKIDLRSEGLRLVVTPDEPASGRMLRARKTTDFLDEFGLDVAINANYFFPFASNTPWDYYPHVGDPVDVVGISASEGRVYSPARWADGTLYLSRENEASFDHPTGPIFNAIAGQGFLVRGGRVQGPFPDDLYPRAALALDREARSLILLVVDGKQPNFSEGASLQELAELIRHHGGHDAIRLDEGGSATLAIRGRDGRTRLLNCPINSRIPNNERPVANHLGVSVRP